MATVLAYARVPTVVYTYRVCMVCDHDTVYFLYKEILYLAIECQLNTNYTAAMGVEYSNFNSGHQESSQPFIVDRIFQPL